MYAKIDSRIPSALRSRTVRLLLVMGLVVGTVVGTLLAFDLWDIVLAAPPIGGNPISVEGPTAIPGTSAGIIRAVVAPDLDNDGHPDLAFGQGDSLRIKSNVGLTTTQWAQTVTVGGATYDVRALVAVDLDRDGTVDLASASANDAGNSRLDLWQNPTSPFTNSWTVSQTLPTSAISLTSIASGDLDRNGTPDLVDGGIDGVLRLWSNPLTGTQPFATAWSSATITTGDQIRQVLVADVDRDGLLDVIEAAGDGSSGILRLWQNPGNPFTASWTVSNTLGTFTAAVSSVAVADLDNDDTPDVVAGLADGRVVAWSNPLTGTQSFATSWGSSASVGDLSLPIYGLETVDTDHDGYGDVVAVGSGTPSTMVGWRNTGQPFSGGWSQITIGSPTGDTFALAVADFNRDGDDDFVTATELDIVLHRWGLQFWTNALIRSSVRFHTSGVSNAYVDAASGTGLHAMDVHDVDRDGLPDVVIATRGGSLVLLRNDGTPFSDSWPHTVIGSTFGFFSVVVGDLDGDNWPDIATSVELTTTNGVTTGLVHVWQNDGTPFNGAWISQTAGTFPRQVMDLTLGDIGRTGNVEIVAATGITSTFENRGFHDVPTSDYNAVWLLRPSSSGPFASTWISSTVCTTTYSANSIALGDLDNDGWTDVIVGTDHAPLGTTNWPDTSGFYNGPAYQVRACRNLGTPYSIAGWQIYDIGRDDAPVSNDRIHHSFWGAHVWSVAVGDLDHDGYLDIVSGGGAEGDYQILVYENDNTPFDGDVWEPTAVGYGSRAEIGSDCVSVTGTYPEDCPWLEDSITAVNVGDLNRDGWLDLVSGLGGAHTRVPLWLNSGTPFGETVTNTHWRRYNIAIAPSMPVYGVQTDDLDRDGRLDVAAVTSWDPLFGAGPGPVRVWRNLGGIARHKFQTNYSLTTIEDGATESRLSFAIKHNGRPYDDDIELDFLRIRFLGNFSLPMDNADASALFQSVQIVRDTNSDNVWQLSDSPVVTVTSFALDANGYQTFTFPSSDLSAVISPGQTITYFVVFDMQPTASQDFHNPYGNTDFQLVYTPHQHLLIKDHDTQASVSVEEGAEMQTARIEPIPAPPDSIVVGADPITIPADGTSTSTISATATTVYGYPVTDGTVVTFTASAGSLPTSPYTTTTTDGVAIAVLTSDITATTAIVTSTASASVVDTTTVQFEAERGSLRINDTLGPGGNEITTHTLNADGAFTVYVAAYDWSGGFINNPTDVTWGGTGIVGGNVSPTTGANSTTFTPVLVGTGTITVTDGDGHSDATDTITVTPGALADFAVTSPSPQVAGVPFSVTVTAYDADGNLKTDYAGTVSFDSSDGQAVLPTDDGSGWSNGAKDFTVELRTTGAQTYSVTDGAVTEESDPITVNPGALGSFAVTSPSPQAAGVPFSVTVTAYDLYDNLKTDYVGTVSFDSSDGQAVLPTDDGSGWSNGAKDFDVELRTTGAQTYSVTDGAVTEDSDPITVNPGALGSFDVTSPSPQTAGVSFGVTVTAYDLFDNLKTDYAGTVSFTSSDGQAVVPTDNGSGWSNGAKDFTVELRTTGAQTYSVTDGAVTEESDPITVNPGALGGFDVTSPSPQVAGVPFSVTVTAYDLFDNLKADYVGLASFDSSDGQAVLPTDDGSGWSNGTKDFNLELRTTGAQTYSVIDGAVVEESNPITVNPGALGSFDVTSPSPQVAGVPFSVTVTAYDLFDNLKTDYAGTVSFDSSDVLAVLPTDDGSGWLDGAKDFNLELWTTGVQTCSVSDGAVIQVSNDIIVNPDTLATVVIRDAAGGGGDEVITRTMTAGDSMLVWAAGYDSEGFYIGDVFAAWTGSGIVTGRLSPTINVSTTFAAGTAGTGAIEANAGGGITDTTGVITVTPGALDHIAIRNAAGGGGSEVFTHTLVAGESLVVWAAGYDLAENYLGDQTATWSGTGVVAGQLTPTNSVSTTFTAGTAGTGTIHADDGSGHTDDTGTITVTVGPLDRIVIEDAAGGAGNEVLTRTLVAGESLSVCAVGYDVADNYVSDVSVTWSGTGVVAGRLAPTSGVSTTFTAGTAGAGTIHADDGSGHTDDTGTITIIVGPLDHIAIRNAAGGGGSEVLTHTLVAGDGLVVWAAGYDVADNYLGDQIVTWSGAGVVTGRLAPTSGVSTTFTAGMAGTGVIHADDGSGHTDDTGTITVTVGPLDHIVIEDAVGGVGNEVLTRTLAIDASLTVWAVGYDVADNYVADVSVTWSGTGVVAGRLAPTSGISTTFTSDTVGTGVIHADDGSGHTDDTGTITVSSDLWKTYLPLMVRGGG